MMDKTILKLVTGFYLRSSDFNGMPLDTIASKLQDPDEASAAQVTDAIVRLIMEEKVTLTFSSIFVNPHIKALEDLPPGEQVERLLKEDSSGICVYPTSQVIGAATDTGVYDDRPFTKRMLLGDPQLTPIFFDLHVLDPYYSDPRYLYSFNDYDGSISVSDEYFESENMPERDQVLLQTFGIGYDSNRSRVVVVFLRYLSDLSAEHQRIWHAHMRTDECQMVYEYYQNSFLAEWAECLSVYQAIMEEQKILNSLASRLGRSRLFKVTYDERPPEFSSLLRPTLKNYLEFVLGFDKMLSDNMSKEFFADDVPLEEEVQRKDGRVEVRQKGTLALLEEWLRKTVRFRDEEPYKAIMEPLREVRKIRQRPAHSVIQDAYDTDYIRQQDALVERVHNALAGLCIVLSTHPRVKVSGYVLPDWLEKNKVKIY